MSEKLTVKNLVTEITGMKVSIRDNGKVWTISNKQSDTRSFGEFKNQIAATFNLSRFDGASFEIVK